MHFASPGLAFGLIQLGKRVSQQIVICNASEFSAASWTLRTSAQLSADRTEALNLSPAAQQAQHASVLNTAEGGLLAQQAQPAAGQDHPALGPSLVSGSRDGSAEPADSNSEAQHAQQAAESLSQGMPAALQAKEQQLMQQLHEASVTDQEAGSEANAALPIAAAVAANAADNGLWRNPFEGPQGDDNSKGTGCQLVIVPEFGTLAPGASTSVQVSPHCTRKCHCSSAFCVTMTFSSHAGAFKCDDLCKADTQRINQLACRDHLHLTRKQPSKQEHLWQGIRLQQLDIG